MSQNGTALNASSLTSQPLVLVNLLTWKKRPGYDSPQDPGPRKDYLELARRLGAELVGYQAADEGWYRWLYPLEKRLKLDLSLAMKAAAVKHPRAILSTNEKVAIPLALWMSLRRRDTPHVVIAHKLSSGVKARAFSLWQVEKHIAHLIVLCQTQADYAVRHLGFPAERVHFIRDKVDHLFYRPEPVEAEDYLLAVGRENRDYETLVQAVSGTGLRLVVVASSPWSTSRSRPVQAEDVTFLSHIPYSQLKSLYARARLVVTPLHPVDYAAGVNGVLEAMSMGRPLIVSRSPGIVDYVQDGETGLFVEPSNPEALRDTMLSLWHDRPLQQRLGANARQAVEEGLNLDRYVEEVARVVEQAAG
ncbi:MAG: glycosyltransferase family 4 protein [Chloroflexi bacterium]|jgi:glycosyltransferase involved in cell wall biosynthesis|nr:glycosyltransferase family 4 protein [Chloroflexota bacterium]